MYGRESTLGDTGREKRFRGRASGQLGLGLVQVGGCWKHPLQGRGRAGAGACVECATPLVGRNVTKLGGPGHGQSRRRGKRGRRDGGLGAGDLERRVRALVGMAGRRGRGQAVGRGGGRIEQRAGEDAGVAPGLGQTVSRGAAGAARD
jgi:hypothetical protein